MRDHLKGINRQLLVSCGFGVILLLTLFTLCFLFTSGVASDTHTVPMNVAVFVAGWVTGWVAGTLVAPYNTDEATLFSQISKGIWAFVSGYLVAKIDPIFASMRPEHFLLLSDIMAFRILMFLSVATTVMLIVFFARKYGRWHVIADVQEPGT